MNGRCLRLEIFKSSLSLPGIDPTASAKENEDPVIRSMGHGLAGNSAFIQPLINRLWPGTNCKVFSFLFFL
jgi:hypothetical protein